MSGVQECTTLIGDTYNVATSTLLYVRCLKKKEKMIIISYKFTIL